MMTIIIISVIITIKNTFFYLLGAQLLQCHLNICLCISVYTSTFTSQTHTNKMCKYINGTTYCELEFY